MRCNTCGVENEHGKTYCINCGAVLHDETSGYEDVPGVDTGGFVDTLRVHGSSTLFFAGVVLWTGGYVFNTVLNFNAATLMGVVLFLLAAVGVWLILAVSRGEYNQKRILTATTLLRVLTKTELIILCIVAALGGIFLIVVILGLSMLDPVFSAVVFALMAFFSIFIFVLIKFYFLALLKVLASIVSGVRYGVGTLVGVRSFFIISCIGVGIAVLFSLFNFLAPLWLSNLLVGLPMPAEFDFGLMGDLLAALESDRINAVFMLVENVGMVCMLLVLKRFDRALKEEADYREFQTRLK